LRALHKHLSSAHVAIKQLFQAVAPLSSHKDQRTCTSLHAGRLRRFFYELAFHKGHTTGIPASSGKPDGNRQNQGREPNEEINGREDVR
jgi:hypothetical protein